MTNISQTLAERKPSSQNSQPNPAPVRSCLEAVKNAEAQKEHARRHIQEWLPRFVGADQIFECRALKVQQGSGERTYSGFFDTDHIDELATECVALSGSAEGVYISLNELDPRLLDRRNNYLGIA